MEGNVVVIKHLTEGDVPSPHLLPYHVTLQRQPQPAAAVFRQNGQQSERSLHVGAGKSRQLVVHAGAVQLSLADEVGQLFLVLNERIVLQDNRQVP